MRLNCWPINGQLFSRCRSCTVPPDPIRAISISQFPLCAGLSTGDYDIVIFMQASPRADGVAAAFSFSAKYLVTRRMDYRNRIIGTPTVCTIGASTVWWQFLRTSPNCCWQRASHERNSGDRSGMSPEDSWGATDCGEIFWGTRSWLGWRARRAQGASLFG
jgi:hypothetical protein